MMREVDFAKDEAKLGEGSIRMSRAVGRLLMSFKDSFISHQLSNTR